MAHLSEQAAAGDNSVLPCVVVLDNLHKAGPLADALGSLPRNLPCLLGKYIQQQSEAVLNLVYFTFQVQWRNLLVLPLVYNCSTDFGGC